MAHHYKKHSQNAEIFQDENFKYFIDIPITAQTCGQYYGHDHEDNGKPSDNILNYCEKMTGQKYWNDFKDGKTRWAYAEMYVWPDRDEVYVMSFICNTYRFAFSDKQDAMLFKLTWGGG